MEEKGNQKVSTYVAQGPSNNTGKVRAGASDSAGERGSRGRGGGGNSESELDAFGELWTVGPVKNDLLMSRNERAASFKYTTSTLFSYPEGTAPTPLAAVVQSVLGRTPLFDTHFSMYYEPERSASESEKVHFHVSCSYNFGDNKQPSVADLPLNELASLIFELSNGSIAELALLGAVLVWKEGSWRDQKFFHAHIRVPTEAVVAGANKDESRLLLALAHLEESVTSIHPVQVGLEAGKTTTAAMQLLPVQPSSNVAEKIQNPIVII